MDNKIKLTTDKQEYLCNDVEQVINIPNLKELGAKNLFLSSDSISKYPIRHYDDDTIIVDTTIIGNNEAQMFRVFAEYDLPKLEITNIQKSYQQDVGYKLNIKVGDWYNSQASYYSIYAIIGEDEHIRQKIGSVTLSSELGKEYHTPTVNFKASKIPAGVWSVKFALGKGSGKDEYGTTVYEYFCETEPMTIEILPSSTQPTWGSIYVDSFDCIFEANKTYYIPIKSTIKYDMLYPAIDILYTYTTGGNTTPPISVVHTLACELENNMVKVTLPVFDDIPNNAVFRFSFGLFEKPYTKGTIWTSCVAYGEKIYGHYFTSKINDSYPKV